MRIPISEDDVGYYLYTKGYPDVYFFPVNSSGAYYYEKYNYRTGTFKDFKIEYPYTRYKCGGYPHIRVKSFKQQI